MIPKKITVRLVGSNAPQIIVEFDGVEVKGEAFPMGYSETDPILISIVTVLEALGYVLNRNNLYEDMDLVVAHFDLKTDL